MANQGGGERVQFKNNPMILARDFVQSYKTTFKKADYKLPEDIELFNKLASDSEMPSSIALRQLRQFREHDGADPSLTILIADFLDDSSVIKPVSWVNREVVRSVLRMAANYDIADFKVNAIDNARGKEVQVDPGQLMVEDFLKKLEEKQAPLPIETRG